MYGEVNPKCKGFFVDVVFVCVVCVCCMFVYDLSSQVEHVCVWVVERKEDSCRPVQIFFIQRLR